VGLLEPLTSLIASENAVSRAWPWLLISGSPVRVLAPPSV
jgi:hypothetical protein